MEVRLFTKAEPKSQQATCQNICLFTLAVKSLSQ